MPGMALHLTQAWELHVEGARFLWVFHPNPWSITPQLCGRNRSLLCGVCTQSSESRNICKWHTNEPKRDKLQIAIVDECMHAQIIWSHGVAPWRVLIQLNSLSGKPRSFEVAAPHLNLEHIQWGQEWFSVWAPSRRYKVLQACGNQTPFRSKYMAHPKFIIRLKPVWTWLNAVLRCPIHATSINLWLPPASGQDVHRSTNIDTEARNPSATNRPENPKRTQAHSASNSTQLQKNALTKLTHRTDQRQRARGNPPNTWETAKGQIPKKIATIFLATCCRSCSHLTCHTHTHAHN